MKILLLLTFTCFAFAVSIVAQESSTNKLQKGVEIDGLPYVTGGYFAGAWVGKNTWRLRALTAKVHKPDWFIQKGFTNNWITAYAMVVDKYFEPNYQKWWISSGVVCWKSSIQTNAKLQTAYATNYLLNGSVGYNYFIRPKLYLSAWGGISCRIAGDKNISIDNTFYTLPLLNPEASVKVGFIF